MSLKNLIREEISRHGQRSWRLSTRDGLLVESFSLFCERNVDYSPRTQKRYAETVARFLDYLFEAGIFGTEAVSARRLNNVIESYPLLLRQGSETTARRVREHALEFPEDLWFAETAEALDWRPMKPASFSNTLAAVNRFLKLSDVLAREELERAKLLGIDHQGQYDRLIKALDGTVTVPQIEIARMRQNSMLGSVAKFNPDGIRRPRGLKAPRDKTQIDRQNRDFPLEHLMAVIDSASSWRDKALWLLLAASGIRTSEARNLLLQDIDFDRQRVYVIDPSGRRFNPPESVRESPRFKGRAFAATYLFPPLRQRFFGALEQYLKLEFVPATRPGEPQYLFQYVEPARRGQPLVNASDAAMGKAFKKAVNKAGVPPPDEESEWFPHSLRHLYGVYMLNDYPLDPRHGKYGLPLTDVQMLMGHASIKDTSKYARTKRHRLMAKLQASDEALLGLPEDERRHLPSGVLLHLGLT